MSLLALFGLNVNAQHVVSFDTDLEGWPAGGNPPNGFATSIVWDAGSGANTGLAILAPKEDPTNLGNTLTQNTIMYGPNNDNVGNLGGFNADAYNYLKVTVKNETIATVLRVRCRRDDGASNAWTQQDFAITAGDTDFKTYNFPLNAAQWSGANSDISIVFRNTLGTWTPATQVSVDRIEFFNFITMDTFAGHVQNPGFDDLLGDDGVWNPQNRAFSTTSVTDEEKVDGIQSLKIAFDGNQITTGGTGNIGVFSTYNGAVGPYTTGTDVTLRAKVMVKYKRNPAASNPDKAITIQGNWKLFNNGTAVAGVKVQTVTETVVHDTWTEYNFVVNFADRTFTEAQFRPILSFSSAMLQYETIYMDAIDSCDLCQTLSSENIVMDDSAIKIYPNPVTNTLNVYTTGKNISKIEVYSILGKKVLEVENSDSINVSALSSGTYISKIYDDNNAVSTKRFIKQ